MHERHLSRRCLSQVPSLFVETPSRKMAASLPIADTASRLMVTSATSMVSRSSSKLCLNGVFILEAPLFSSTPVSCAVAFVCGVSLRQEQHRDDQEEQSSSACSGGSRNRDVAMTANATRRTIASHCHYQGNPTASAPITRALSPLRTDSIIAFLMPALLWTWPSYLAGSSLSVTLTVRCWLPR